MKKTYLGIFSTFVFALNPIFSDGFSEQDREFIAEKGIFPPDDPNNPHPSSDPNRSTQNQKPLLPPEEPNDSTPAPGPSPSNDQNQRPNGSIKTDDEREIVPETKTSSPKQVNPNNPINQKGDFPAESETGN